jgi:hypothetical protein
MELNVSQTSSLVCANIPPGLLGFGVFGVDPVEVFVLPASENDEYSGFPDDRIIIVAS